MGKEESLKVKKRKFQKEKDSLRNGRKAKCAHHRGQEKRFQEGSMSTMSNAAERRNAREPKLCPVGLSERIFAA